MDDHTTSPPQDGKIPPPFTRSNTSSTTLYFDTVPSMSSLLNSPRGQSRSGSSERRIKSSISAPIPTDPAQNLNPIHINGHTNMGDGGDDKTTLRAGGSTHVDDKLASDPLQQSSPVKLKPEGAIGISRLGNNSPATHDPSPPSSFRKRSSSRSDDHNGGLNDERSLRSVPVVYTNTIPEGEELVSNRSLTDVSRKASVKRSPSKLVKRRSVKGKTEYLANGHSLRGEGSVNRRPTSRTSQRSFRSSRGPVFDMVTAPPNATLDDAGGAFATGAVMAAPENEVESELRSEFQERLNTAERSLSKKQTKKILKEECALMRLIYV